MRLAPHRRRAIALASLVLAAGGCNVEARVNAMAPPAMDARSRDYLALFTTGQPDSAYALLTPKLQTPEARAELRRIAELFRGRSLDSMQRTGVQVSDMNGERHINLAYQFHDAQGWFLATVATTGSARDVAGGRVIEGVSMRTIPQSLDSLTAFTFAGRGPRFYFWLLAAIVAATVSIGTAVRVGMTKGMPRRWLWVFVALIGVGRFSLDWSTGVWNILPVQVLLFSAAAARMGTRFAPWVISFGLPLGAILAERKRRRWLRAPVVVAPADAPADAPAAPVAAE